MADRIDRNAEGPARAGHELRSKLAADSKWAGVCQPGLVAPVLTDGMEKDRRPPASAARQREALRLKPPVRGARMSSAVGGKRRSQNWNSPSRCADPPCASVDTAVAAITARQTAARAAQLPPGPGSYPSPNPATRTEKTSPAAVGSE